MAHVGEGAHLITNQTFARTPSQLPAECSTPDDTHHNRHHGKAASSSVSTGAIVGLTIMCFVVSVVLVWMCVSAFKADGGTSGRTIIVNERPITARFTDGPPVAPAAVVTSSTELAPRAQVMTGPVPPHLMPNGDAPERSSVTAESPACATSTDGSVDARVVEAQAIASARPYSLAPGLPLPSNTDSAMSCTREAVL